MAIIGMSGIRYCDAMVNTKKEDAKKFSIQVLHFRCKARLQRIQVILFDFEPNDQSQFTFYLQVVHFQGFSTTNDKSRLIRVCNKKQINNKKPRNKTKQKHANTKLLERISVKCFIRKQLLKYLNSYNQKDSKQGIDTRRRTDLSGL